MSRKKQTVFPKHLILLEQMGENIKLARKRRKLTAVQVAERADIVRTTLYKIEKGNPSVAIGAYFNVLRVLGLQDDFLKLASDDELGRKLQDLELLNKKTNSNETRIKYTYLMVNNEGFTKIGKSFEPTKREKTLQSQEMSVKLYAVSKYEIESFLHDKYKEFRVRGEWFKLSKNTLESIIKEYSFIKVV